MDIETKSFSYSCDIIVEEKFIPDVDQMEISEVNDGKLSTLDNNIDDDDNESRIISKNKLSKSCSQIETGRQDQLFKCKTCKKKFKSWGNFKRHGKICEKLQNASSLIVCQYVKCQKTFTSTVDYEEHKNICTSQKSKNVDGDGLFRCDEAGCLAEFDSNKKIKAHKLMVHIPRRFVCLYCDLTFKIKSSKVQHERRIHLTRSKASAAKMLKMIKKIKESKAIRHEFKIKSKFKFSTNQQQQQPLKCKTCKNSYETWACFKEHEIICQNANSKIESSGPEREFLEQRVHSKRSKFRSKIPKKLKKQPEITRDKIKPKSRVKEIEINQEFLEESVCRITRSRNKNTSFANFFDLENDPGSAKKASSGSDDDTTTTASFDEDASEDSSVDDDDKDKDILALPTIASFDQDDKILKEESVELKEIEAEESESDEYLCSVCYEGFTTKSVVKNHEKKCKNDRTTYRKNTKKNIKKFKDLEIHCEYEDCNNIFSSTDKYNLHIDSVHNFENYRPKRSSYEDKLSCFLCRKKCQSVLGLGDHMEIPHKIKCPKCSMIFIESAQLYRHRAMAHSEELKKFQCPKCPKKFRNEINIKNHARKVHEKKIKICPICSDKVFDSNMSYHTQSHVRKGLSNKKQFCEPCQVYLTRGRLEKHFKTKLHLEKVSEKDEIGEFILPHDSKSIDSLRLQNKSDEDQGIFDPAKMTKSLVSSCHDCGLKFRNIFYRDDHRVKYHGYQKPEFHCLLCDINFSRKSCLTLHLKNSMTHKIKEKEAKENQNQNQ